jgi:uncharacterized phiE125 gp8 family phage protein
MGIPIIITEPTIEPVTLAEAKSVLRVSHDDDDMMIAGYIKSAREWAENYADIYIMTQVVEWRFDRWPGSVFNLDLFPLQSVDSIKYDDTSSPITEQTLTANTDYWSVITKCGRIEAINSWPSLTDRPDAVKIRCTVGYADTGASPSVLRDGVPETIKTAIKMRVKFLYENDPCANGAGREIMHRMQGNRCV